MLLAFAAHTLSRSPCLGIADNQDFWRVMRPAGIDHIQPLDKVGHFVRCTFRKGPERLGMAPSSSALLALLAKHLSWGLPRHPNEMDLRQMGLTFLAFVATIVLVGLVAGSPPVLLLVLLYALVDPGYLLFFNSFYADPALFIAILGIVIWFSRLGDLREGFWAAGRWRWAALLIALVIPVFIGGASKMQYVLLPAVVLVVLTPPLYLRYRYDPIRTALFAGVLLILAVGIPWHFIAGPGPRFVTVNNYHAVYGGLLRVSTHPDRVFRSLDIPGGFRDLPRRDVFSGGIPNSHPVHRHLENLSRLRLLGLYATDPRAVLAVRRHIERALSTVQSHPRGNRVRDAVHPELSVYQTGWQYSKLRRVLVGTWPPVIWVIMGGAATWLFVSWRRRRWDGAKAAILFLLLWAATQFVVVVLGDGLVSLQQHLIGARLALDFVFVLAAYDIALSIIQRQRGEA